MRRTNYLTLFALLAAGGAASAVFGVGCGGDDSGSNGGGQDASPTPDGSPGPEAGPTPEAAAPDASTPDTSIPPPPPDAGLDSGHPDTGTDSGHPDTGTDSGEPDTGTDSGEPDTGTDSGQPDSATDSGQPETGADSGPADAAGDDASDATAADTGSDATSPISFTNPLQVDVSSLLTVNTVVATATGGVPLTPMDGTANSGANNDFPTQAEATLLNDAAGVGLPNNAFFAGNGTTIPNVQLRWSDAANVANSLVVVGSAGTTSSFNVPPAMYSQVQIYATGGSGSASLTVTLNYASGAPVTTSVPLPDWCTGSLATGEYKLVSVDRVQNGNAFSGGILCSIYALDLNPDSTRVLSSVSFVDVGGTNNYLVFYGATAW
jgi:hypothetical protein